MTATTLQPPQVEDEIPAFRPRKRTALGTISRIVLYVVLIVASAGILLPFYWMIVSSLKTNNEVFTVPIQWLPSVPQWQHYVDIFARTEMITWLQNTAFLAVVITGLQLFTGSFAAYGFSKGRFPGRNILFLAYIGTIAVPWQSYMIPQFVIMTDLGLANTLWAMVALQAFTPFGVFLMKQFFDTIPEELSEAGRLDGLSEYGIYARIMMPLSIPAIASLTLLSFTFVWNDFLGPLIYLRNPDIWTVQLGLRTFIGQYNADYSMIMTGAVLSVLPVAIIFLLGQRFFVEGIASTGVKG